MPRTVRLLDVDHDEIRIRKSRNRPQAYSCLIFREFANQFSIDRLEFGIRECGKAGGRGIDALDDAKIRLWLPETNIVVNIIHVAQNGSVARNETDRAARQMNDGEIGLKTRDEITHAALVRMAFKVKKCRDTSRRMHVGGTG